MNPNYELFDLQEDNLQDSLKVTNLDKFRECHRRRAWNDASAAEYSKYWKALTRLEKVQVWHEGFVSSATLALSDIMPSQAQEMVEKFLSVKEA